MTSAIEVLEQINDQLVCAICLDRLVEPRLLICMHTFCTPCIQRISNNDASASLTCPTCRKETPIPETGVESLHLNFFVNQMLDVVRHKADELKKEIRETRRCEGCENNEEADVATSRCVDCNKPLCTTCVADHKRVHATLDHRVIAISEGEEGEDQALDKYSLTFCKYHTRNVIKYFCITCDEAICRVCTILEHREHQYVYPKEALPLRRNDIQGLLEKAKSRIPLLKGTLKKVDAMSRRLKDCHQALAKEIHQNTQARVKALIEGENELLKQLAGVHLAKQKVLGLQKDSIELELGKLTGCCDFADNVFKFGNEIEVLQMKGRLEAFSEIEVNLEPEEDDTVQYICDNSTIPSVVQSLGQIRAASTFASISFASGEGIHTARVKVEAHFKLITKDRHGKRSMGGDKVVVEIKQPDGSDLPCRIEDKGDGSYMVYYIPEVNGRHLAHVMISDKAIMDSPFTILVVNRREYKEVGGTIMKFGQYGSKKREFKSPFGVAIDNEGRIYVADSYNHRVQVLGTRGEFITSFGSHGERRGEFNCPTDVDIDNRGRVIICDNGNNRVQVLNRNGGFIGKFGREGTGNGYFKSPWGLAVTANNEIVVADMENNRVQMFSPEGKFMMKFGSPGDRPGQFNAPGYLLVNNEDDQIFVSDSKNHRIQVFDMNGVYIRSFGSQGAGKGQFMHPRGLAMDIAGHLIIADMGNHRLQILNSAGEFVKEIGSEGSGDGQLSFPESVAIMPNSGYIVVSDLSNNRIHVF
ncbi:predicted protein [Nematostella vectensis]|uniref:Uncharacterized protein n=1 Tax=Nematostella vectensis TaxID=45351 RepID=A7SPQ3_NEMVE|nr:E3 ubiquitin-protein ligase TRIM71 [Nematostella vectensis]XP_048583910.1 E3 ubiquitin-protein ligase TRIM71 [Nematostella vectensis]EDO34308.1 predicted protein [Nematostella vectensis]|eukprot:XP_001626408.1 predicted protein [Nematostella vectensis]